MSTSRARILPTLGRVLRGIAWAAGLAILAASGAGLVGLSWHAPGSPARAELTYAGDAAMDVRLDVATEELRRIGVDVGQLADEAKIALEEVTSADPTRLRDALTRGGEAAARISTATDDLLESLAGLPGDGPNASIEFSNATLVRRAAVLAAIDASSSLAAQWQQVTGRAVDAATLVSLISKHDTTVLEATAEGRANKFKAAATIVDQALLVIEDIQVLRVRLIASADHTVLDEWVERTRAWDVALRRVYNALVKSKGEPTIEVLSARRDERAAFAQLPPDRRTIIVIVAEVARGGLTEAVLAIEEARGRLDEALAEAEGLSPPEP